MFSVETVDMEEIVGDREVERLDERRKRNEALKEFLDFADKHRVIESAYKFNREECYDRKMLCDSQ